MKVFEHLFLLLLCCYAVRSRSCLLLSFLLWKKNKYKWIFFSLLLREVECFGGEISAMYDHGTSDF